jgi:OmpA-OmpF porin, OOP family
MFNKHLVTLAVLASLSSVPLVQADELAPVINQQPNLLPPITEPAPVAAPTQTQVQTQAAAPTDTRWYVAPYGSFVKTGGDRNSHDGWGGGVAVGKPLNKNVNVEVKAFGQTASGYNDRLDPTRRDNVGGSWDFGGATADVQYFPMRGKFSPYAVVGVGGMNTSVPGRNGAGFIGEAGAGFTYEVMDNLAVRSDVRYRYNQNFNAHLQQGTDEFHDMTVNLGVQVPLGNKPKAAEPIVVAAAPAKPVADCSALDSDADGVNNCVDKCPGTIAGSKVDATGCPISLELKGVNFKYDSAQLTDNAMYILDGVAQSLINYPVKADLEVHGHTSSEGSNAYNLKLSQKRSQSVANYLASKGVANRLVAKGYGESQPIADNSTEQGRERNRRVELIWTGN